MHLHFERNCNAKCDCTIISLSWMGKVPDELPEDEGWKLNRTNYYQEGWLATAHTRGIVGVTFTTSHCKKAVDYPLRTNYNLRGHRSAVVLVKWNEPYQKLASCDSSGIIFVWIKYEGRWSIELINDRNTPVTHFAWSHDGRMALICYQDGFVLVGSVAGQRYWSSMLSLESTITCGIWTPDDLQVYFGTSNGGIVVMDVHGAMVAQVSLSDLPVVTMAWSCEKFKMEEGDDIENQDSSKLVLAVCLGNGCIFFMKSYDDVSPIKVYTGFTHLGPMVMEWSNSRHLLAVAGVTGYAENGGFVNMLKCYTETGELLYCTTIPHSQDPVSALTWGHNDKRLFVATGGVVHIAWVARRVASLQLLSRLKVASSLPLGESSVKSLPLPPRIKHLISNLFAQTIRCCVPESKGLREFVSRPPINGTRLHCTMIRHDDEHLSSGACYTLYLEYLGGLVPLLKGKRTSKIRPEFVIFDPQAEGEFKDIVRTNFKVTARGSDTSDTEKEDGCNGSPRVQRRRRRRRRSPADYEDGFTYVDTLPEDAKLVEVTSNIWGTKFKIHGLADCVPSNLGQITYKTSLLHLQPRQMSLVMTELSDDVSHAPDPSFNPKVFSEDEEDERNVSTDKTPQPHSSGNHPPPGGVAIPIAPMTPRRGEGRPRMVSRLLHRAEGTQNSTETNSRYFTAPRFIYQYPSLRERVEMRRAMYNVSKNLTGSSLPTREDHEILEKPPVQMDNVAVQTTPITEFNFEPESLLPSSSTRTQPSLLDSETSTSYTYHNDLLFVSKKMDEVVLLESHVDKKEPRRSEIEETGYPDVHLAELISLCESLKFCDFGEKGKARSGKPRQEKTETSFLNNQTPSKPIKSPNVQSPKNAVTCLNLQSTKNGIASCHFYENGGFDGIAANPSTDCASLSTQKVKTTREKRFNQERIGTDNMKNLTDETENLIDRMSRSCSVGYLDDVDTGLPPYDVTLRLLQKDSPKRLFLVGGPKKRNVCSQPPKTKSTLKSCGKSRSLDSGELLLNSKSNDSEKPQLTLAKKEKLTTESPESQTPKTSQKSVNETSIKKRDIKETTKENVTGSNICLAENSIESLPPPSPRLPRSQPVTPAMTKKKRNQSSSPIRKHLLNSPLLRRRRAKSKTESSDDDNTFSGDEAFTTSTHFKDLETFQKAQLRQKLKRGKVRDGNTTPKVRELVMHNKAPMWNESSQVYQLDFGGRVTQESAKNFQIEFKGKQVMQFGRIDGNAYTLDFQYPFSVLQAFSVALANVTQRLK